MKSHIYLLLILAVCIIGCKKKDAGVLPAIATSTPATSASEGATGGLKGIISPLGAVLDITAAIEVNGKFVVTRIKPGADGSFFFKDLPKGSGGLTFTPAVGYVATNGISILITGGKDTDLGTVTIPLTPGSLSGTVRPAGSASEVRLRNDNLSGNTLTIYPDQKTGIFRLENVPVGTYTLDCTAGFGYTAPVSRTITITTAHSTDAGIIQLAQSVPGSISGTVLPAGSVASVTALFLGSPATTYNTVPDASGTFRLQNVIAGNYRLTFKLVTGSILYGPVDKSVSVTEGKDTNVGAIASSATPPPSNFTALWNGSAYKTNISSATYIANQQSLSIASYIDGGYLTLNTSGIVAPGEYICNSTTGSYISFVKAVKTHPALSDSQYTMQSWNTRSVNGTGVIKITFFDRINKTVSGTFSGTLTGSGGTKNLTEGVLTNVPYQ